MSWDIYIQDLPPNITSVAEIPDDFKPAPLGPRAEILARIRALHPGFAPDRAGFASLDLRAGSIGIYLSADEHTTSVTLSVRGGSEIVPEVAALVRALGGRALDTGSDSGIFNEAEALASYQSWCDYRDQVVRAPTVPPRPWWRKLFRH